MLSEPWNLCKCGVLCYNSDICKPCILKNRHIKNECCTNILYLNDINLNYVVTEYKGSFYYIKEFLRMFFN